jgi:hypothetical protein
MEEQQQQYLETTEVNKLLIIALAELATVKPENPTVIFACCFK